VHDDRVEQEEQPHHQQDEPAFGVLYHLVREFGNHQIFCKEQYNASVISLTDYIL
jgi:hypothetical protein